METTATREELERALEIVNKKYGGNIIFNRMPEKRGSRTAFTIKVKSSKGPGHRRGFIHNGEEGKRLASACWHAHGDLFDAIFKVNPEAVVIVGGPNGKSKITASRGNWQDRNIGSMVYPIYFSEACDCGKGE